MVQQITQPTAQQQATQQVATPPAKPVQVATPPTAAQPTKKKSKWWIWLIVIIVLLIFIGVGLWFWLAPHA